MSRASDKVRPYDDIETTSPSRLPGVENSSQLDNASREMAHLLERIEHLERQMQVTRGQHSRIGDPAEQEEQAKQSANDSGPPDRAASKTNGGLVQWLRAFVARYSYHEPQTIISVHTWAFSSALDPATTTLGACFRLLGSLSVVVLQITVLISIVNESTMMKPCEAQDDCSPGQFCFLQDISAFGKIADLPEHDLGPRPMDFRRRCWDCVYTFLESSELVQSPSNATQATEYMGKIRAVYGDIDTALILSLGQAGLDKCMEEDKHPLQCDPLIQFTQTLTGANVVVLILSALILTLPLIDDFQQAITDYNLVQLASLRHKGNAIRTALIGLAIWIINTLRIGVLPAMTTISTSALLLATGASTQNILLNFAAISIVTTFDDQLMQLFLHPTEAAKFEATVASTADELATQFPDDNGFRGQLWLPVRLAMVMVTMVCMPIAILNVEGLTMLVAKSVPWPWNVNVSSLAHPNAKRSSPAHIPVASRSSLHLMYSPDSSSRQTQAA